MQVLQKKLFTLIRGNNNPVPIQPQKSVRGNESGSLVSVVKRMVVDERFKERSGFFKEVLVIAALRAEDRRLQRPLIPCSPPRSSTAVK